MGVFGNKNNATGVGSSLVVECENVLLLSLGKTIKVLPFFGKENDATGAGSSVVVEQCVISISSEKTLKSTAFLLEKEE